MTTTWWDFLETLLAIGGAYMVFAICIAWILLRIMKWMDT